MSKRKKNFSIHKKHRDTKKNLIPFIVPMDGTFHMQIEVKIQLSFRLF